MLQRCSATLQMASLRFCKTEKMFNQNPNWCIVNWWIFHRLAIYFWSESRKLLDSRCGSGDCEVKRSFVNSRLL